MRKVFYKGRFVFIPLAAAGILSIISFAVMQLWNSILPGVLRVSTITFWQAMGIFVLCKILFGFGGGRKGGAPWMRRGMQERFKNMSSEEREQFRKQMGSRFRDYCGGRKWGRFNQQDAQNMAEQETSTANNSTFNP